MEKIISIAKHILNNGSFVEDFDNEVGSDGKELISIIKQIDNKSILDNRLNEIQTVLFNFMQEDFSSKIEPTPQRDEIDALALTINFLGDELNSQREKILANTVEKETLLKEVHHRVKNNLQIITSLLSLQSGYFDDEKSKALFLQSQYRINSMGMIHELLYQTENLSKIDYKKYIYDLSHSLLNSFKGPDSKIVINIDSPDIFFNIDTSIPLGLLINEILTNSFKYGLIGKEGVISIKLRQLNRLNYILEIGDNGIGFSDDVNFSNSNSLGLKLIHNLTLQLRGDLKKDNSEPGTNYVISFQEIEQSFQYQEVG